MIQRIQRFFSDRISSHLEKDHQCGERALQIAAAALMIEVSRADFQVQPAERKAIVTNVQRLFGLDHNETDELIALAEEAANASVSLYQFTQLVDKEFSPERKAHLVEMMWRVAYADNHKDMHEEHVVRKIADLLHVPQGVFTRARHVVETEPNK